MTAPEARSRAVDRYVERLDARRGAVLAASLLVIVLAALGVRQLEIESSFTPFMPSDSSSLRALERMRAAFDDDEPLLLLVELAPASAARGAEPDAAEASLLAGLDERLSAVPGVADVSVPSPTDGGDAPSAATASLVTVHDGVRYALVRVAPDDGADPQALVSGVQSVLAEAGVRAVVTGEPRLVSEAFEYVQGIVTRLPPIALLLILVVFRWRIGSTRGTLLSLVPAVVAAIVTMGTLGWSVGSVSLVTALVPIFVLVLGSADGLHLTSHVLDRRAAGAARVRAVSDTLAAVAAPIAATTVTTMAGFLALTVIDSPAVRQLGVTAATGVLVAGIASVVVLPTLLLLVPTPTRPRRRGGTRDALTRALARLRGAPSLAITAIALLAFAPGALRVQSAFSMVDVYKPTTDVRRDLERATIILGGSLPIYVTAHGVDPLDERLWAAMLELQDRAQAEGVAARSVSLASVLRDAWFERSGAWEPPPRPVASLILGALRVTRPEALDTFVAPDGTSRAMLFLPSLDTQTLTALETLASEVSARASIDLDAVGIAYVMRSMNERIVPQQLASLALAFALVFALTLAFQRSLRLAAVTLVPIACTLVVQFGAMGYLGIDLSVITGIMTGLTIGVGIDYAIHYAAALRRASARGEPDPADAALGFVATPVLANALGLAIGFSVMALSPLQIHVTLAVLMWVTMLVSAFLSLTLLPSIAAARRATAASA